MLQPLRDRVLVRPSEEEKQTSGGIVLPDTARKRPQEGEVLAVGAGRVLDTGLRVPPSCRRRALRDYRGAIFVEPLSRNTSEHGILRLSRADARGSGH